MGKYSSGKKSTRLIREISECLGYKVGSISREAIQHEFTPLLYDMVLNNLESKSVNKAVRILLDYNITVDMFKENVLDLMDGERAQRYASLHATVKTKFTKAYKAENKTSIISKKKKKIRSSTSSLGSRTNDEESESETGGSDSDYIVSRKSLKPGNSQRTQPKRSASENGRENTKNSSETKTEPKKKSTKKKDPKSGKTQESKKGYGYNYFCKDRGGSSNSKNKKK